MTDRATVTQRIAATIGDAPGSYEHLIGVHICTALGIDPSYRGQLVPSPNLSTATVSWLHAMATGAAADAQHATEILTALKL